jgi:tetratricopeptide (TPR) repeat protein
MIRTLKKGRIWLVFLGLALSPVYAFGQDLGSSNDLFRASNPKTRTVKKTEPAPKKNAPVKKSSSANKKTTPKSSNTIAKSSSTTRSKPETTDKTSSQKTTPPKSTAQKSETIKQPENTAAAVKSAPKNPAADELFEQAIEEGNTARDRRDYILAESAYRRAEGIKPKDSRAIYGVGNLYSDQQRWEEAEKAYRRAIQLEPNTPDAYIALSFVLTQPIVGKDLSLRYTEAERMARRAIELDGNNPVAYDQLGVALELSGRIDQETRNAYRRAVQLDPTFALAYAHLGRLLRRNGQINESASAYRKAMQYSTDVPTMILVADVLQSQQRYTDSEQLLRAALREDPKNPTALYLLGRALTTRAAYDEAEKVLKKSVEVSPNSFVSYALLGSLYSRRGDFNDAEKILTKALKVVSENERKRLALEFETVGDGLVKSGKKKDAVRVYQQALALDTEKQILADKLVKARAN